MCAYLFAKLETRSTSDLMTILDHATEFRLLLMVDNMGVSYSGGH